ncbi:heat shock 70 kDa protein 12A-like [Crassostrea angulata]|uniref:heat shock 70 kDa protein 12A-like n=1 Tax=Magallana angulata TaxID=2784310 RepID=UPI0022B1B7A7|nr:heat shock 70 kDa protein 12A-like [Crassostrea angulata]XP_052673331.1 heat shock 70 kDa protein 12A-like [Crassostrea angulata]XP_052673332.1 heat shock 70 kDa protein 12A-like [Crassostrea angulata]XP_052673333.1 heat shock 70 kDa protein 12A-like [Crassostrea angulata]
MEKDSKCTRLVVAAIDFGTTFSGYAFSLKNEWGRVFTNQWTGGNLISPKAPTCLLLKKDFSESFFGYEAEDKYTELTSDESHKEYYFFQRFKMILHQDVDVKRHILCYDISGEALEARLVFQHCIKCLKDYLYKQIEKSLLGTQDGDIEYVLTVPAIWGDKAKMFMREAALKAGIKKDDLTLALEPEAASVYCQYLNSVKEDTLSPSLGVVKPGTKYMVIDLGGGTADITVHQKCEDNTLEEVLPASGGPWGGKAVDDRFMNFLKELVGENVWEEFQKVNMDDYLDIMRCFESKKRTIVPEKSGKTRMTIPQTLVKLSTRSHGVKSFKEVIQKNDTHKNNVGYDTGKLVWNNDFFRGFFKKTIDGIVKHIDEIIQESEARDIRIFVMVGGFSECLLVQDAIKKQFGDVSIIVPEEAGLAVLKGAVFFGHVPDAISRRSARYTYGFQTWPEFREGFHPKEKKVEIENLVRCRDVFLKIVTKGEKVMPGYMRSQIFQALHNKENILECGVFVSDKKDPKFIDDPECRLLGRLQIPLNAEKQTVKTLIVETLIFGETELKFKAEHVHSEIQCEVIFDLLKD